MERVKGIIEDQALVNGRVDIRVRRADGSRARYEGVVLYDDKMEPIDLWTKAEVFCSWREEISRLDAAESIRVAVLVVKTQGGSTTQYIEPGDRIVSVGKHGKLKLLRLLYVEDDKLQAGSQMRWMSKLGWEITHVTSSKAAVEKLGAETFDAVLTDWNLVMGDTAAVVVSMALDMGYPTRIFSGLLVAEHSDIWLSKINAKAVDEFLEEVREGRVFDE